jgi:lipopolysaccharide exporter
MSVSPQPYTPEAGSDPNGQVRNLSHGALWSGINTLITKLAGIAVTVVVVRIVTPHDFGVFSVALIVYAVVSSFGELGLSACIARRDIDPARAAPVVATLAMASYLVLAGLMAVTAGPLAAALGAPEAVGPIRVLSLCILLSSLTTVPSAMLVRDFRQGRLFAATAISFIPANGVLVLLALGGDGAMAFAWSRVVGQVVAGIVVVSAVKPWFWPGWNRATAKLVLSFGLPLAGANLLNYLLLNADYAFIGRLLGPALLGTYTLAFNVASWSTSVLGGTINGVAMPAFSGMREDPGRLRETLSRWVRLVCLIAFPVSAMTMVLSTDLIHVLYGPVWAGAAPILGVLSIYGALFVVSLLLSNLLVGIGRTGKVLLVQAVWLTTLVFAVWLGVTWWGVLGAAVAHVLVIVVFIIPVYLWALRTVVSAVPRLLWHAAAAPLGAAAAAALAAFLVTLAMSPGLLRMVTAGAVGGLVYLALAGRMLYEQLPEPAVRKLNAVAAALPGRRRAWARP